MRVDAPRADWYEDFFAGAALDLWRRAIPHETTEEEVAFLHETLEIPQAGNVLDVPCGNGRLSLPMALMGYQVTGLDSCSEFISEAKAIAKSYETEITYLKEDMRQLPWKNEFDAAFCMGNSFGYFDREGSIDSLSAICESLKSGAKFILDSAMIAECFLVNGADREWVQRGDMYMLIENIYNTRLSCVETTYTFIQNGKEERRQAIHWIYTSGELCRMAEQAGFTIVDLYSSTEGEEFTLGSDRLLLLAQKK